MSRRLSRLVRENKRTADELADAVLTTKPKKSAPRKPVRCIRNLESESGGELTAAEVAAWVPLIPAEAKISPGYGYYRTPHILSALTATWYEDDR